MGQPWEHETLAAPWARGTETDPVRRLRMAELCSELAGGDAEAVECVYRFRDRVVPKGCRGS